MNAPLSDDPPPNLAEGRCLMLAQFFSIARGLVCRGVKQNTKAHCVAARVSVTDPPLPWRPFPASLLPPFPASLLPPFHSSLLPPVPLPSFPPSQLAPFPASPLPPAKNSKNRTLIYILYKTLPNDQTSPCARFFLLFLPRLVSQMISNIGRSECVRYSLCTPSPASPFPVQCLQAQRVVGLDNSHWRSRRAAVLLFLIAVCSFRNFMAR